MTTKELKRVSISFGNTQPVIDLKILDKLRLELRDVSPDLLAEFVALYLKHAPVMIVQMKEAIKQQDGALLNRLAHTLKANSARLGAYRCRDLCQKLEILGERAQFEETRQLVDCLETQFKRTEAVLRKEVPRWFKFS